MHEYNGECIRQLSDTSSYKEIQMSIANKNYDKINTVLDKFLKNNVINKSTLKKIKPIINFENRKFYLLPKIHKDINKWPTKYMPPGRPIVNNRNTELYNVCKYLQKIFSDLNKENLYTLNNSEELLENITTLSDQNYFKNNDILFNADVTSLYTNMNLNKCINFLSIKLNNSTYKHLKSFILELTSIVLFRYDFFYKDKFYLQTNGVSMGCSFAGDLANLYLNFLDLLIIQNNNKLIFYCR